VHAKRHHLVVVFENLRAPVTLVHVDVDDDDGLFDPKFLSHDIDRDRDVVEDAEPFASVSIGVVRSA